MHHPGTDQAHSILLFDLNGNVSYSNNNNKNQTLFLDMCEYKRICPRLILLLITTSRRPSRPAEEEGVLTPRL